MNPLCELKSLAIVPARSGSKGIADKNMRVVAGKTLIAHAAACLRNLDWITDKILSTDSKQYAEEAKENGLSVPFLRPENLSSDTASVVDVLRHAVNYCEKQKGIRYDCILIIEPTSPVRTQEDIKKCMALFTVHRPDAVVAVSEVDKKFYPEKILKSDGDRVTFYSDAGRHVQNRQEMTAKYYYRNGVCYIIGREHLFASDSLLSGDTLPYVVEHDIANIDTPSDLLHAEKLLSVL